MVGERLGVCANSRGVKLVDRIFNARPAGRNDLQWAVQVHADLAQRAGPMGLLARRQVRRRLNRFQHARDRRLQQGLFGH